MQVLFPTCSKANAKAGLQSSDGLVLEFSGLPRLSLMPV